MRHAIVFAESLAVLCPKCGESLPEPKTGSEFWTPDDYATICGKRATCPSCDLVYLVSTKNARIDLS